MGIKSIFSMLKADRYTQDGRDKLAEDKTYQTGQISEKTGLQKQPDGSWAPPKNGNGKTRRPEEPKPDRAAGSKPEGKPGRDFPILKKEDHVKLAKEVISNTLPGGSDWTAEEIAKEWQLGKADAEEVKKAIQAVKTQQGVEKTEANRAQAKKIHEGVKSYFLKKNEEQRKHKNFMENSQKHFEAANSVATTETDKTNLKKIKSFMDEEHGTFKNALYNNAESLVRKGSNGAPDRENEKSLLKFAEAAGMGDDLKLYLKEEVNSKYDFGGGDAEKKPAAPKPSVQEYMKAQDTVKKYEETYKKQLEEYENGQRLRANGGGAILDPMYGLKPNDLSKNADYMKAKDIIQRMEARDHAPLTGDTKIKVRRK